MKGFTAGMVIALCATTSVSALAAEEEGKAAFNNSCRTCHSWKEATDRLGRTCMASSAGKQDRFRASTIRALSSPQA